MLLSIALLLLIIGTIIIERTAVPQKPPADLVPVKVEIPSQENKRL